MQDKLEKYLYKKHSELFVNEQKTMNESPMVWGCTCGDGWFFLLDKLCDEITNHIKWQHNQVDLYDEYEQKGSSNQVKPVRPNWAKEKIPQVHFDQVKEKFGRLTVYYSGGDETIGTMVDFASSLSRFVCEECGKFDLTVGSTIGWIKSICYDCFSKDKNDRDWSLYKSSVEASEVMKQALEDKEKQKGKEFEFLMKKAKEIEKRSKK